jgi:hypothetical protein
MGQLRLYAVTQLPKDEIILNQFPISPAPNHTYPLATTIYPIFQMGGERLYLSFELSPGGRLAL